MTRDPVLGYRDWLIARGTLIADDMHPRSRGPWLEGLAVAAALDSPAEFLVVLGHPYAEAAPPWTLDPEEDFRRRQMTEAVRWVWDCLAVAWQIGTAAEHTDESRAEARTYQRLRERRN